MAPAEETEESPVVAEGSLFEESPKVPLALADGCGGGVASGGSLSWSPLKFRFFRIDDIVLTMCQRALLRG